MNPRLISSITLIAYFIVIACISVVAYRATKKHSDYVLGGRKLNSVVTALGVGASDMSGWLMLGLPGAIYLSGLSAIWLPIGLSSGALLSWLFVAKPLRTETEKANNALTIPSFLSYRFNDYHNYLRITTSLIILIFFTFYSASGFVGCATLFMQLFDINYYTALLISAPLIIIYTSIGGFLAVNWVDVFQGFLMLFALLFLPIVTIISLGGWENTISGVLSLQANHLHAFSGISWIGIISWLAWGLGYFGQPHILVRFMASETANSINMASKIAMSWMILSLLGAVAIGLSSLAYLGPNIPDSETVFLRLSNALFNPWISGILFAAVLSSIMSTIAAQLHLCATSVVEDGYRTIINPNATDKTLVRLSRSVVVFVALGALLLAYNPESKILTLVGHAWAGLGASFGPVILSALFCKKVNLMGAITGMVMGAVGIIAWIIAQQLWPTVEIFELYEMVPGFLLGSIGVYIGSRIKKPRLIYQSNLIKG